MEWILFFFGRKSKVLDVENDLILRIKRKQPFRLHSLSVAAAKESDIKKQEAQLLFSKIKPNSPVVVLDKSGKHYDSINFSFWVQEQMNSRQNLQWVIGGAQGLDDDIISRADYKLSFGKMTWTKDLCRYMLIEQIYRAIEIQQNSKFHK